MKIIKYLPLGLFFLLAGMTVVRGRTQASRDKTDHKAIDEYITQRMSAARIPGIALAIVKGDQIVYLKGYGRADESGRPVTPQTSFIIGSITKPFTAMAVMQLVDAGQVELDAPVQRYIPWFRVADGKASAQITVRMLINQTSGLPQAPTFVTWKWPDTPDAIERHVRLLASMHLLSQPGASFAYSNANYVTLGLIVQMVSGQPYEDYIRQHLFAPLDMRNSFVSQDEAVQHGMATGYRWWFGYPVAVTFPYNRANLPAGFIISSAEDMAHFLIAQMNDGAYQDQPVLSADKIALMQTEPESGSFGMGWDFTQVNGRAMANFDGGTANFQASLLFDPETKVGVFVAANAMSALDTLSASRSQALLNGISLHMVAESVMSLATNQPLPPQGIGLERLTVIFDLLILALTGVLVNSFAGLPRRNRRLRQHEIASRSDLLRLGGKTSAIHFAWPLVLLAVALFDPSWIIMVLYQPDLISWLYSVAALTSIEGLIEIAFIWRTFRRTQQAQETLIQRG